MCVSVSDGVPSKLARARWGVGPYWGITVIPTCGAAAAPVMPQVGPTWGRGFFCEAPVRPSQASYPLPEFRESFPEIWAPSGFEEIFAKFGRVSAFRYVCDAACDTCGDASTWARRHRLGIDC